MFRYIIKHIMRRKKYTNSCSRVLCQQLKEVCGTQDDNLMSWCCWSCLWPHLSFSKCVFTNNLSSQPPSSWSKSRMTVPAKATVLLLSRSGQVHLPARCPTWKLGPVLNSVFCNFQLTFFPSAQTFFIHLVICFCFLTKSLPLISSLAPVDCKPHTGTQINWKCYMHFIKIFLNNKHVFGTSVSSLVSF